MISIWTNKFGITERSSGPALYTLLFAKDDSVISIVKLSGPVYSRTNPISSVDRLQSGLSSILRVLGNLGVSI